MPEIAADRQTFLAEIIASLRDSSEQALDPADRAEDLFYEVKQRLLDRYQPASPQNRAIASISWDEVERSLPADR